MNTPGHGALAYEAHLEEWQNIMASNITVDGQAADASVVTKALGRKLFRFTQVDLMH